MSLFEKKYKIVDLKVLAIYKQNDKKTKFEFYKYVLTTSKKIRNKSVGSYDYIEGLDGVSYSTHLGYTDIFSIGNIHSIAEFYKDFTKVASLKLSLAEALELEKSINEKEREFSLAKINDRIINTNTEDLF